MMEIAKHDGDSITKTTTFKAALTEEYKKTV
jgi:hypothetical protein